MGRNRSEKRMGTRKSFGVKSVAALFRQNRISGLICADITKQRSSSVPWRAAIRLTNTGRSYSQLYSSFYNIYDSKFSINPGS